MMYSMLLRLSRNLDKLCPVRSLLPLAFIGNFNKEYSMVTALLYAALPVVAVIPHSFCKGFTQH